MNIAFGKIPSKKLFDIAAKSEERDVIESCLEILGSRSDIDSPSLEQHAKKWALSGILAPDHELSRWIGTKFNWDITDTLVDFKKSTKVSKVYRPDEVLSSDKTAGEIVIESLLCLPFEQKKWADLLNEKDLNFTLDEKNQLQALFDIEAFDSDHIIWSYIKPSLDEIESDSSIELREFDPIRSQKKILEELDAEWSNAQEEIRFSSDAFNIEEKMKKLKDAVKYISNQSPKWQREAQEKALEEIDKVDALMKEISSEASSFKSHPGITLKNGIKEGNKEGNKTTKQSEINGCSIDLDMVDLRKRREKNYAATGASFSIKEAEAKLDSIFGIKSKKP